MQTHKKLDKGDLIIIICLLSFEESRRTGAAQNGSILRENGVE